MKLSALIDRVRRTAALTAVSALVLLGCTESTPTGLPAGTLTVTATTTGSIIDPNGYTVTVDGSRALQVASNGSASFYGVPAGVHEVTVSGIAPNCMIGGEQPIVSTVQEGVVGEAAFEVACELVLPKISFISERDGNFELYLMDPDGSNQVRLTNDPVHDSGPPSWSRDGRTMVFQRIFGLPGPSFFHGSDIYVMQSDGSGIVQLTDDETNDSSPSFSPDGTKILFSRSRTQLDSPGIWVMNVDGTGMSALVDEVWSEILPAWSPDGAKIVYNTRRDGNWNIYVMDVDGSNRVRLTDHPEREVSPQWSPDGSKIVFVSDRDGNDEIYTMNPDGSAVLRLTHSLELPLLRGRFSV